MWTSKPVPPTRYEAILQAIQLTDEAIDNAADDYTTRKLLLQRLRLVEALTEDEDLEDEDEDSEKDDDEDRGHWKCENCGRTGNTEDELSTVDKGDTGKCPECGSYAISFEE